MYELVKSVAAGEYTCNWCLPSNCLLSLGQSLILRIIMTTSGLPPSYVKVEGKEVQNP